MRRNFNWSIYEKIFPLTVDIYASAFVVCTASKNTSTLNIVLHVFFSLSQLKTINQILDDSSLIYLFCPINCYISFVNSEP